MGVLLLKSNKISLMDAYMIETLRSNGISNDEIINFLEKKDVSSWGNFNPDFEFDGLIKLYEQNKSRFNSVLTDGYTVKFLTINGLKNLLKMKFNKIAEENYILSETGIQRLEIDADHLPTLAQLLSINWTIEEHTDTNNDPSKKVISIENKNSI